MKKMKQTLATVLCVCILFSMDGINIQAAQAGDQNTLQMEDTTYVGKDIITGTEVAGTEVESTEATNTEAINTEATNTEATNAEATSTEATNTEATNTTAESIEAASTKATDTEEIAENTQKSEPNIETNEAQAIRENMLLSYMVVGSDYVEAPGTQYVLAGIGDGTYKMESATLHYINTTTTKEYTVDADTIDEDSALFNMDFADESYKGSYEVTAIDYVVDGNTYNIDVTTTGVDAAFGVDQEVETNPDAVTVSKEEQDAKDAVVITDANGNAISESDLAAAVESASEGITDNGDVSSTGSGNLVIVLDPGHGGTDPGACYSGLQEKNLNLAIAAACKAELETYTGVTVYMTRTTDDSLGFCSPNNGESLQRRVDIATSYHANVLISFHNNAASATASGSMVLIPNSNYRPDIGTIGSELASKILAKLVALGLKSNGTILKNCVYDTYADGSLADWYGLIRRAKTAGFPCIIIEHAFMTNSSDVSNYLVSATQLQAMGVADATGIAEYFNLIKGDPSMTWKSIASKSSTSLTLKWNKNNYVDGYQIYRSTSKSGKYKKIATISNATTTSYTDKKLKAGKTYYYKIRSTKGSVSYSFSSIMSAYPLASTKISSIKSNGSGSLKIVWSKVKKATGYQVYRSTTKTGTYKKIKTISSGKTTSYKDKTVKRGKNYYYRIVTVNSENGKTGYSSKSARVVGWSIAATKIKSITSQQNGRLKIKWSKIKNAKTYQVYRSTSKNGTYKKIATTKNGSTTSYEDKTVTEGTTYYYKIRTVNYVNNVYGYGDYSGIVSGKQLATTAITFIQSTNSTSIKVKWSKISGATGYELYRCETKSGTYQLVTTIMNAKTVKYTDKTCISGKNYYYKVQVVSKTGKSALSDSAKCTTVAATSIQSVQSMENNQLNISWTVVSGAEGYRIYRSTSENGTYTKIKTISGSAYANYVDTVTDKGVTYYYKVKAFITSNVDTALEQRDYSNDSNVASGQVLATPEMNDIIQTAEDSFTISWSQIAGATGYYLYRKDSETGEYSKIAEIASEEGNLSGTYTDTDVTIGTTYYYKAQAYNTLGTLVGVGDYTSEKSAQLIEE